MPGMPTVEPFQQRGLRVRSDGGTQRRPEAAACALWRQRRRQDSQEEMRHEREAQCVRVAHEAGLISQQRARVHRVLHRVGRAGQRLDRVGNLRQLDGDNNRLLEHLTRLGLDRPKLREP
eukprot:7383269-Prymnesium_polylepis.1